MSSNLNMETSEHSENDFKQQCSSCDVPSFSGWCLDCHEALCKDCVSAHRRVSVTRSHRILNQPPAGPRTTTSQRVRGDTSIPPTKFCRVHPSEPLKLFCLTCNQLTCRDCQLMTHMNHRYEFVGEALDSLKKQLEDQVQPIRAQRETVKKTLQDMEARLQDIVQYESSLKFELQQSFSVLQQHLTQRMDDMMKEIQKVYESECEWIQRRMVKLKQLQQSQQSVTEVADKAKNTNHLPALIAYRAQIESDLRNLPDQDVSPPQTMPQMKVVTERNSVEALLKFGQLEISWTPFSVSQTSSHNKETSGTTASSININLPISTCSLQSATAIDPNSPVPSNSLTVLLKSLSANLFPSTGSTSESHSTSSSSSSTCLIPSSRALLQTVTTSIKDSPLPVNQTSVFSKSLSRQFHCSTLSSCSSSTVPASPTSTCTIPSCRSLLSNSTDSECISPSSSAFKNSNSNSSPVAPPTFTPTRPNQNRITNYFFGNKHLHSLHNQLVCPPPISSFSSSSSSTLSPPTSNYPAPTCKPLSQRTGNCTRSWKSSLYQVYLPPSSSLCSTSSSSSSSFWDPNCTAPVSTQLSPAVSSCQNISQSRSSPVNSTQHVQPMVSSPMLTLSHPQTNINQVQIKCVEPLKLLPVQSSFPPSAGSTLPCNVLKPAQQSTVLHRPAAPNQNQSPVVLLTDSRTVYQLACWPISLPSPVPLLPMLTYSLPEKTCSKQQKQCSLPGSTAPSHVSLVSGSDQMVPATTENCVSVGSKQMVSPNQRLHHQTKNKDRSSVTPPGPLTSLQAVFSEIRCDISSPKPEQHQSHVVKAVADSACDRSLHQVESKQQDPIENEPNSTMSEENEPPCETTYNHSEEPESVTGEQEESEGPESVTGGQEESEEPESVTGGQEESEEPESVTGGQEESEEPESVTGGQEESEEPESVTGGQEESEEPESVTGEQEECEEPESVTGGQEESEEPESVTGEQEDFEKPECVIQQRDYSLSQLQPKVLLFRLPVAPSRSGCPLSSFRLVPGVAEDEIYLEEMSEDSQSHVEDESDDCEDVSEQPSSPESPVTLQIVSCSACGSANGSIICLSCGRGYHRDCHVPPVGPKIWSEWICSLCQDPSDPSDSHSSGGSLTVLDQRRCESLLLYLKVEGWSRLSQSGLKLISDRLTLHHSPYSKAANFLSDIWDLFKMSSPQDSTLNKLQKDFHVRLVKTFGSEIPPSLLMPPNEDSQEQNPNDQIASECKLKETRKRLRQFLVLMGTSRAKRKKRDVIGEGHRR